MVKAVRIRMRWNNNMGGMYEKDQSDNTYPFYNNGSHCPITILGRSKRSLRIEKQKVEGTGAPDGFNKTQCE